MRCCNAQRDMPSVNPYYGQDQDNRAARVKTLFNQIAPRYDLVNDVQSLGMHRLWKRRLLTLASVEPGERALDACCGTGDITLALAGCGAIVTGIDFSLNMLEKARSRCPREANVDFLEGDAMALPFPPDTFNLVTIAYGLRNLSDFDAGLKELIRVLRPEGRLLILDFGKPKFALWRHCYFAYLRWVVPVFGWFFCGDWAAYRYILDSLEHYPAQEGIATAMRSLNMTDIRIDNLLGGVMSLNFGMKAGLVAD
ncbi:MAG: Demethylmenaquinone methyltransferase [Verrucomicrobia subdivision 3 bacterium]|nr:Demethylmenaquinone methyltransferase [Limisphaerales bacterium]MCS1414659.1 Demethylmenaquinone methyltransferase [Limisphaerales bacterium]